MSNHSTARSPSVVLDDARPGQERLLRFRKLRGVVRADRPEEVPAALDRLGACSDAFKAGYFSYELGYLMEPRLERLLPPRRAVPLLWFGLFEACEEIRGAGIADFFSRTGRGWAGPLRHEWSAPAYAERFARAHDLIGNGDIYQVNLSFRSRFRTLGDPLALYARLRTAACGGYGAYVDDGERQILSLSPELFFDLSTSGMLTARPMKGTAPRGAGPSGDAARRAHLAASTKDRAENLMIVDLLRNDLGRIAQTGSVAVENLFAIETYPTLHTMVSTVTARIRAETGPVEIVKALFPCGSVTGAPKIRAMEIIRALEDSPRGVYCGAIGHFAPDGGARFNVAIRTLTISGGRGELGIGGAVVHDSRAGSEYDECLLKARYFEAARRPLMLIETLRHDPACGFVRLPWHLSRMESSAAAFGITFDRNAALRALNAAVSGTASAHRVRLTLNEEGVFACAAAPLGETATEWTYTIARHTIGSSDALIRHKTDWRECIEAAAAESGADEVIFCNERGEITEGSRSNVFAAKDGRLCTPPLSAGLLNGCLRQEMLAEGRCIEAVLRPEDLQRAEKIWFGNSLRGLIPARPKRG